MSDWSSVLSLAFATVREKAGDTGGSGDVAEKRLERNGNFPPLSVTERNELLVTPVTSQPAVTIVTAQVLRSGDIQTGQKAPFLQHLTPSVTIVTGVTASHATSAHPLVRRLTSMSPPRDFSDDAWSQLVSNTRRFLDRWASEVGTLRWSDIDLVGVHPLAPTARYDAMGLLMLVRNGSVVDLRADAATIQMPSGSSLVYLKRISAAVPVYHLA